MFREQLSGSWVDSSPFRRKKHRWDTTQSALFLSHNKIFQNWHLALVLSFYSQMEKNTSWTLPRTCALSGFWVVPSARNLPTHSFTTMKFCQSKQLQPHCSKRTILVADIHTQGPLPTFVVPGRCHPTVEVYKASPPQALTKLSANSNRYSTIYLKNELSECKTPHCSSSFSNKPQQKEGEVGDA